MCVRACARACVCVCVSILAEFRLFEQTLRQKMSWQHHMTLLSMKMICIVVIVFCLLATGEAYDIITFGKSTKKSTDSQLIGMYGNGLKS